MKRSFKNFNRSINNYKSSYIFSFTPLQCLSCRRLGEGEGVDLQFTDLTPKFKKKVISGVVLKFSLFIVFLCEI